MSKVTLSRDQFASNEPRRGFQIYCLQILLLCVIYRVQNPFVLDMIKFLVVSAGHLQKEKIWKYLFPFLGFL